MREEAKKWMPKVGGGGVVLWYKVVVFSFFLKDEEDLGIVGIAGIVMVKTAPPMGHSFSK